MTDEVSKVKKKYYQEYRNKNREILNAYQRTWRAENRDKVQQINQRYWENKVLQGV